MKTMGPVQKTIVGAHVINSLCDIRAKAALGVIQKIIHIFAPSNKPDVPGETFHQTYPTAVKGHYGGIVSRPV